MLKPHEKSFLMLFPFLFFGVLYFSIVVCVFLLFCVVYSTCTFGSAAEVSISSSTEL